MKEIEELVKKHRSYNTFGIDKAVKAENAILSLFSELKEKVKELEKENDELKDTLKTFHLDMEGWEWKEKTT
jgi:tetrahydromethanopterin S-methyltransferase subunit B